MANIENIFIEISNDVVSCLEDGFSKVIIYGEEENYKDFLKRFSEINKESDFYLRNLIYSRSKPEIKMGVYQIDIDNLLSCKNPQNMSRHRREKQEYDLRAR